MPRPFNIGGHIGAVMLHCLKAAHRPAKLRALLDILHRHIQHRLGAAHHLHAVGRGGPGQGPLDDGPSLADFAQHGGGRHGHALQAYFA